MRFLASLLLTLAALSQAALAQEPPTRVGRLAFTQGSVALYQDPDLGWEKAYVNSPVTSENSIWTDPDSRAEMRVSGMAVRLDETTQLDIATLDENDLQAFVSRGSVAIRVRHFITSERLDFATPHAQFRLSGNGRYRIDVDPDRDETVLTVFTGSASMRSSSGNVRVAAGAAIRVRGGDSAFFVRERARTTTFDRWTLARDERWIERSSTRYVSTAMTGYEDLDAYGEWNVEPEFGPVWFPSRVSSDWAPYRHGRWDWVRPWGWTWIAEEPWGYAPYHYGRWVYVRDRWGWYPGERVANPVWAPALVAWVGGSNFSVGISSGRAPAMGWYPLAPWERYEPWYRTNTAYVTRVNRVVRESPPRQYRDQDRSAWRYANRDRGATVVQRDTFTSGRPVAQAIVPVTREAIRQAQPAPATTVLPGREEFRRTARVATQPPALQPGAPATAQAPQAQPQDERTFRRGQGERAPAARPNFERRQAAPAPAPATAAQQQQPAQQAPAQAAPAQAPGASPFARDDQRTRERAAREQQQAQERAQREQHQAQERAQREQQQAQERAGRGDRRAQPATPAQPAQPQAGQPAIPATPATPASPFGRSDARTQERAAREQQQAQEKAQREQQQAQERAQREAQQAQERAQREAQQQQQRQAQEKAQREQQQAQEKAQRDAQQQQRQAQEKAQREQQQAQEKAQREAQQAQQRAAEQQQQQQQRQAQEKAQREAQQAQERAAREAQQAQQRAEREAQQRAAKQPPPPQAAPQAVPQAPPPQAAPPAQGKPEGKGRGRDKTDKEKEEDEEKEKEKGRGKGR
jgi:hypothetical protein